MQENNNSSMIDFTTAVVNKPWGYEYLLYSNDSVAAWLLNIRAYESTSLHAHEHKLTGLIGLSGHARLSFLSDGHHLSSLDKRVIHPGVFHRTEAISDFLMLEIETPIDKADVVRFKDIYGREGKPYESADSLRGRNDNEAMLKNLPGQLFRRDGAFVKALEFVNVDMFSKWVEKSLREWWVVVFMRGGVSSAQGVGLIKPGHVVWSHQLKDFLKNGCKPVGSIELLLAWREDHAATSI